MLVFSSLNEGLPMHQGTPLPCVFVYVHTWRQACAQVAICISVNESDKCALFNGWMLINGYYLSQYSLSEKDKKIFKCWLSHLTPFRKVIFLVTLNISVHIFRQLWDARNTQAGKHVVFIGPSVEHLSVQHPPWLTQLYSIVLPLILKDKVEEL